MKVANEIYIFLIILTIVLLLDGIMLMFLHSRWNNTITNIQGEPLSIRNKVFPIITYILIVIGIRLYVYPYFVTGDIKTGLILGFIWGIITYGIFDFTNLSIFKKYPTDLAIIDTIWGGLLAALTGIIASTITTKLNITTM